MCAEDSCRGRRGARGVTASGFWAGEGGLHSIVLNFKETASGTLRLFIPYLQER